jgi:hypothetical protein
MPTLPLVRQLAAAALLAGVACSATVDPNGDSGEPLHATVAATIDSSFQRALVATLSVANRSNLSQTIHWSDDCVGNGTVDIHVIRNGAVIWNSALMPPDPACPTQQITSSLAAGVVGGFGRRVELRAILGDSIAAGQYDVVAVPTITSTPSPSLVSPLDLGVWTIADPIVVPPGTSLDGSWTGTASGLALTLTMHWTSDSVTGTGTYTTQPPASFACAGGTIGAPTGPVQLLGSRDNDLIGGRLLFDAGEGPPFYGHLRSADSVDVTVTTIDTPSCALELKRTGP